ncbi:MAG: dipeptidase [bacterium]
MQTTIENRLEISEKARQLTANCPVIDLHVDAVLQHLLFGYNIAEEHNASWLPSKRRWLFQFLQSIGRLQHFHRPFFNHIDLPRMQKGGYTAAGFGIHYWPFQSEKGWHTILRQIDYLHQKAEQVSYFNLAKTPEAILHAAQNNQLAGFLGVEGAHCLGKSGEKFWNLKLQRVEELFNQHDVRYLTLSHFCKNDAATPCLGRGSNQRDGLTAFGKDLVQKMNELGMIIDLAHVNHPGVLDACKFSRKPVVVTHTGVKAVHDFPRNINDEAICAVAETGGVVGVMFATNFLSPAQPHVNSEIILEHLGHIINLVGENHAAIGSDFDGWIPRIPIDMTDARDLPILTQHFLMAGFTKKRIEKILGGNFLRVWKEVLNH